MDKLSLFLLALAVPALNFFLLMRLVYGGVESGTMSLPVFIVIAIIVGILTILFFTVTLDTPIEGIVVSAIILFLILAITPTMERARQNASKRARRATPRSTATPLPLMGQKAGKVGIR